MQRVHCSRWNCSSPEILSLRLAAARICCRSEDLQPNVLWDGVERLRHSCYLYTARIWNAIRIRFRERYVGDNIVKIRRRWVPPKLFGVQSVAYRRRVRLQYASNTPQYPIRPQYVGVIVLNGFYCSSNYLQSDRHTIYIEAIFVIVPVVFEHCCVHTNQFPFHSCRLVHFQPSAA